MDENKYANKGTDGIIISVTPSPTTSTTICKPVEVSTKGNIPQGNYAYGDEYEANANTIYENVSSWLGYVEGEFMWASTATDSLSAWAYQLRKESGQYDFRFWIDASPDNAKHYVKPVITISKTELG